MRLAKLPQKVQSLLAAGSLSAGHARALLAVKDPEQVAIRIIEHGLTVRDVERIAQDDVGVKKNSSPSKRNEKDPDTRMLEKALEDILGLSVSINHSANGGELRIKYRTLEQLDDVCQRLRD
jgi:ParB family chromosome partitioning protein